MPGSDLEVVLKLFDLSKRRSLDVFPKLGRVGDVRRQFDDEAESARFIHRGGALLHALPVQTGTVGQNDVASLFALRSVETLWTVESRNWGFAQAISRPKSFSKPHAKQMTAL